MNVPPPVAFRSSALVLAAVLGLQCIWLLLAELSRPDVNQLPTEAPSATIVAKQRSDATWAAWIGGIRGDLWAQSAFTFTDLLWANPADPSQSNRLMGQARVRLDRAVRYGPLQSEAWLLLAGLASRYQWPRPEPAEALKMAYYTAPSDSRLLPLRLLMAARSNAISDPDVQQFVRRDLRLLMDQQQKPAVVEAYQSASPEGKRFIEEALSEIDPTYLGSLRAGGQKP
jgi:hypothetical protein